MYTFHILQKYQGHGSQKTKDFEQNIEQIDGLPANSRQWTHDEIESLKAIIIETPEQLEARGAIAYPHKGGNIVPEGNETSAVQSLGWDKMSCIILPKDKLQEIVLKGNNIFSVRDTDALANE